VPHIMVDSRMRCAVVALKSANQLRCFEIQPEERDDMRAMQLLSRSLIAGCLLLPLGSAALSSPFERLLEIKGARPNSCSPRNATWRFSRALERFDRRWSFAEISRKQSATFVGHLIGSRLLHRSVWCGSRVHS
jgi:hypothetical protein